MKQASFITATAMLAGMAVAEHHNKHAAHHKRDVHWVTQTADVYVTDYTTLWVEPSDAPEHQFSHAVVAEYSAPTGPPEQPVSSAAPVASSAPVVSPIASSAPYVPSVASSAPVVPPVASSAPVASVPASSYSGPSGTASAPASGETHDSFFTYYDPQDNPGSCGSTLHKGDQTVAMPPSYMKGACGQHVKVIAPSGTFTLTVADTCMNCTDGHIDIPQDFAAKMAISEAQMVHDGTTKCTWIGPF